MAGFKMRFVVNHRKLTLTMDERRRKSEQAKVELEQLNERVYALFLEKNLLIDEFNQIREENIQIESENVLMKSLLRNYLQSLEDEIDRRESSLRL